LHEIFRIDVSRYEEHLWRFSLQKKQVQKFFLLNCHFGRWTICKVNDMHVILHSAHLNKWHVYNVSSH